MGFEQLKEIIKDNLKIAREEEMAPITKCPDCAWPVLKENKRGGKLCPICHWRSR